MKQRLYYIKTKIRNSSLFESSNAVHSADYKLPEAEMESTFGQKPKQEE